MKSQENFSSSTLPHDGGSVESSKSLAMGCKFDFVGGRLEDFPSLTSLVVIISFVTLKI